MDEKASRMLLSNNPHFVFDTFVHDALKHMFGHRESMCHYKPGINAFYTDFLLSQRHLADLTEKYQRAYIDRWSVHAQPSGTARRVSLYDDMFETAFEATVCVLFDKHLVTPAFTDAMRRFIAKDYMLMSGIPHYFLSDIIRTREFMVQALCTWRARYGETSAYASDLLEEREKGSRTRWHTDITLTDRDLAVDNFVILYASSVNTFLMMFWTLYHIYTTPHVLATARASVITYLNTHHDSIEEYLGQPVFSLQQLEDQTYLKACIQEALRLHTSGFIFRDVVQDFEYEVKGERYLIKRGERLVSNPAFLHFDPVLYPNPDTFDPDRYSEKKDRHNLSFGGGVHYCPGRKFARNEILTAVIHYLVKYDLEFQDAPIVGFGVGTGTETFADPATLVGVKRAL